MAEYRTVRMSFWNDPYIEGLDTKAKLLYLYLFTGPHTNNLGILEVTRRKIAYETAMSQQDVDKYLAEFEARGKIVCDLGHNLIFLTHFILHQTSTSPKILQGLKQLTVPIPSPIIAKALCIRYPQVYGIEAYPTDTVSIPYAYGMHTLSIPYAEFGSWKLEDGKGKTRLLTESSSELLVPSTSKALNSAPPSPVFVSIPLTKSQGQHPITEADVEAYQKSYPAVDVRQALRDMAEWCKANQTRRKTKRGVLEFIRRWLSKEQDRGGASRVLPIARPAPPVRDFDAERLERNRREIQAWAAAGGGK